MIKLVFRVFTIQKKFGSKAIKVVTRQKATAQQALIGVLRRIVLGYMAIFTTICIILIQVNII